MITVGCELGTDALLSARRDGGGGINHRRLPTVYVEVTAAEVARLQAAQLTPVTVGSHCFVLGDDAWTAVTLLGVPPQRPLVTGALDPADTVGPLAVGAMLQQVLGRARPDELCHFTLPPAVIDGSGYDLAQHQANVTRSLALAGYTSHAVATPLALARSYGPQPTALGVYCDLGLVSVGLYYDGRPLREFSLQGPSGHAVDRRAAAALGQAVETIHERRTRTMAPLDLTNPADETDATISYYMYEVLGQLCAQLAAELITVAPLPHGAIPLVAGGSGATGLHFIDLLRQACTETASLWPVTIGDVMLAASPGLATVTGLLA